jgi:hypothetical protein
MDMFSGSIKFDPGKMSPQAIQVYRSYYIWKKMKITCWYKNGSLDAFRQFCTQNQDKPISVKLTNRSEHIIGALDSYCLDPSEEAHLFLLLTDRVTHPAYYGLEGIESLHIGLNETLYSWADSAYAEDRSSSKIMASRHLARLSAK